VIVVAETQISQRLAAFAAAVTKAMTGAREVMQAHEEQQRLAQSRARRRDLDRPRISVHKGEVGLFSRLPNADPRNLLRAGGRLSQDFWYVWALEREPGCGSFTGTYVGVCDTWDEAMLVAHQYAERKHVLSTVDDDAADYVSWGEVPC